MYTDVADGVIRSLFYPQMSQMSGSVAERAATHCGMVGEREVWVTCSARGSGHVSLLCYPRMTQISQMLGVRAARTP